jgi:pimeloyl-ACP methyl ester carboxylesterase
MEEIAVRLPRGEITLRGVRTARRAAVPTLCLHGWLDNCASFEPLLARLDGHDLVAIDLPGHGLSDPVGSATCQYLDYAAHVLEFVQQQGWQRFRLVGHSLGGALASLIAGIHPEKVPRLVLIDAIGPLPTTPDEACTSVARYLRAYLGTGAQPAYRTPAQAVRARIQLGDMLQETAEALVARDLHRVPGGYSWRSDVRLKHPPARTFTEDQIRAYLRRISASALLVLAERTYLTEPFYPGRIEAVPDLRVVTLAGGHHLHMENADAVADAVRAFLEQPDAVAVA